MFNLCIDWSKIFYQVRALCDYPHCLTIWPEENLAQCRVEDSLPLLDRLEKLGLRHTIDVTTIGDECWLSVIF